MPPKSKNKKKNAFGIFLDDYVESQRAAGRLISHRIGAEECALLWEKMPPEERKPYAERAAVQKEYSRQEKETKFTSCGVSFAEFDRKLEEERKKVERGEKEIEKTMQNLNSSTIRNHLFYTIHCHYLARLVEGIYMPGEIGICEFSLESGIRKTYHRLINSGSLPIGYGYEAKLLRDTVHDLPMPPYEEGVSDFNEILNDIFEFVEPGRNLKGERPPFYTLEDDLPVVENILLQFSNAGGMNENFFRVIPLHKMFFALKNRCAELGGSESVGFPVLTNAITEIEKDTYRYVSGISCDYHSPSDRYYHSCSRAIVQRYVYLICDHCCHYLDIPLVPGKHIRKSAAVKEEPKEASEDSPFLKALEGIGQPKEEAPLPVEQAPIDYWDYTGAQQAAAAADADAGAGAGAGADAGADADARPAEEPSDLSTSLSYRDRLMAGILKSSTEGAAKPEPDFKKVVLKKRG